MKPGLPFALTMIALAGSGVALATFNGRADPANVPARMEEPAFSPADRAAFLDAGIAALHAGLTLSPEQEKLWPAVETALRTAANNAMARRQKFKDTPAPATFVIGCGSAAKPRWRGAKISKRSRTRRRLFMRR